jgi:hypothetical protein
LTRLGKLWTYSPGFVVRSTTYSGTEPFYDEALTIAPGVGLDGNQHHLVVVDVAPG